MRTGPAVLSHAVHTLRCLGRLGRFRVGTVPGLAPCKPVHGHKASSRWRLAPVASAGAALLLPGSGCLFLEEASEESEDVVKNWNHCQPRPLAGGPRVFVWGNRACLPVSEVSEDQSDLRTPMEVAWFQRHAAENSCSWRQLSFGPSFGAARSDRGELFLWGSSLRKDGKGRQYAPPCPLVFKEDANARFQDVQCSESAVWALTADGDVVVWEMVPTLIEERSSTSLKQRCTGGRRLGGLKGPVKQMSVGVTHAAFLTKGGEVYCLGRNACGECGVDPAVKNVAATCTRVKFPRHCNPILRVECGRSHTVAVGAEGQCLSWGDDSKIQLGLGDTRSNIGEERPFTGLRGYINMRQTGESMATASAFRGGPDFTGSPRALSTSQKKYDEFESHQQTKPTTMMDIPLESERQVHGIPYPPPSDLRCGDDFTLVMVRDSPDWYPPEEESQRVFCCGENGKGQCGRSMQQQQQIFAACKLPRNSQVLGFSCGSDHCLAVVRRVGARKQELWCWGSNAHGQAGGTTNRSICPASRLRLPKGTQVEAAWCGFSSSAVICSNLSSSRAAKLEESD